MLELRGAPALSAFRHARLLTVLRERVPEVEALSAHYVHFIDVHSHERREELDDAARERLVQLLDYGTHSSVEVPERAQRFLVVPRLAPSRPGHPRRLISPTTAACAKLAASSAASITGSASPRCRTKRV